MSNLSNARGYYDGDLPPQEHKTFIVEYGDGFDPRRKVPAVQIAAAEIDRILNSGMYYAEAAAIAALEALAEIGYCKSPSIGTSMQAIVEAEHE